MVRARDDRSACLLPWWHCPRSQRTTDTFTWSSLKWHKHRPAWPLNSLEPGVQLCRASFLCPQNRDAHAHHRPHSSSASFTGGESSYIPPQGLICFFLIQPVNLEADLFSSYSNRFEMEPNHSELLVNVLGLQHTSLCSLCCPSQCPGSLTHLLVYCVLS